MKRFAQIVIAIQFVLMLTHCATSTDDLYSEYAACREQTLIPKVSDTGIVQLDENGDVAMVYQTGACPDELAKWEKSHALKEKRRRDRAAYTAAINQCGDRTTLVCAGRGVTKCISRTGELSPWCRCECMSRHDVRRMLGGRQYRATVPTDGLQFRSSVNCEKKNF